jgi:hypothetical protein
MTNTSTEVNQEMCHVAKPQKEHEWLTRLVGEWTYEGECSMGPDQPPMKSTGKETVRSLGGLWMVGESEANMPNGEPATMIITLGYDPKTNRYVGTWVGSMMTHMWHYDGEMDASGKVLTLNAEGPSFADPNKTAKYQDIIEVKDDNHRILRSQFQGEDGKWTQFMTANYKRTK